MSGFYDELATNEGGELTEEEFVRAAAAIMRQPSCRPATIVTSQATIDEGRHQASVACSIALWADRELEQTRWWRFGRRRWLGRLFHLQADNAESLWATFGTGGREGLNPRRRPRRGPAQAKAR